MRVRGRRFPKEKPVEYSPVSVIMPVLNNLNWTRQCVESVYSKSAGREFEFIVIDNNSTDGTSKYLDQISTQHNNMRVIKNEQNIGVAPSWNQGVRESKYDYVCIINNDIIIQSDDWLFNMVKVLKKNPSVYWTSPRTCYSLDPKEVSYNPSHFEQLRYNREWSEYVVACCFACPKSIFDEDDMGMFDEDFDTKYYEDLDFISRILEKGKRVKMASSVLVYHGVGKTSTITPGGAQNKEIYMNRWKGKKGNILARQPGLDENGNPKKGIKHFESKR